MSCPESLPDLTSAMEDYLEAIYHLEQERRIARVRDIANRLGVKMSSVSSALKSLGSRGLIKYDPHQYITLTERGLEKARQIVRKHEILKRFLVRVLKLDEHVSEDNACRIEHHLDPEVIEKLVRFVEFIEMCPMEQTKWLEGISDSCDTCHSCLDQARDKVASRAEAQKAALEEGRTLAEAQAGSQLIVEGLKNPAKAQRILAEHGLEGGVVVEVEQRDAGSGELTINVKGYHVKLTEEQAGEVLVKPV